MQFLKSHSQAQHFLLEFVFTLKKKKNLILPSKIYSTSLEKKNKEKKRIKKQKTDLRNFTKNKKKLMNF